MGKKLSLVIVTKDTKELLENLLHSIEKDRSLQPLISKVIVIDNASADGTDEVIRTKFPAVVYIKNERNMGFASAANKGFSLAEGEYILFLNSDTILIEEELVRIVDFMDNNADVAICGPELVYPDMKPQRSFAAIPSLAAEFFPLAKFKVPDSRFKVRNSTYDHSRNFGDPRPPTPYPRAYNADSRFTIHDVFDVHSLIGAAILVRRETFERLSGFDERFFFFLEETDLCVRSRAQGKRVVFFLEAKVIHLQGKTVRQNWIQGRIEYNISLYKFMKKHHALPYYAAFVAVRFVKAMLFVMLFSFLFFFLFGKKIRMKYVYYLKLILWHFGGCLDNAGLRPDKGV